MSEQLSDREWMAMLNVLTSGAIRGIQEAAGKLDASEPGKFPHLTDSILFEVATVLSATLLDAHPDYADSKRFGKAADKARTLVLEYLRVIRGMSELAGRPMLFAHIEPMAGPPSPDKIN